MVYAFEGSKFALRRQSADSFSVERQAKPVLAYGAKVILTPAAERRQRHGEAGGGGQCKHGWFLPRRVPEPRQSAYHPQHDWRRRILQDFAGRRLDAFVITGWGTGAAHGRRRGAECMARPEVKIVVSEPAAAPLLADKPWSPHKIQGWTPGFRARGAQPEDLRRLNRRGRGAGARYGAAARPGGRRLRRRVGRRQVAAALVCRRRGRGSVTPRLLPDTGERYLSTFPFEGVEEGSDDAWLNSPS